MVEYGYTKQEILKSLPRLPGGTKNKLSDNVITGLKARKLNSFVLIDTEGISWTRWHRPDPKLDLRRQNAWRRRSYVFTAKTHVFMQSLNEDLSGGKDYPIVKGALGLLTGGVAGVLFSLFDTAMSAARSPKQLQAREGDEIWQLERIGRSGGRLVHVEYFLLVDPFRKADRSVPCAWSIHEGRLELELR